MFSKNTVSLIGTIGKDQETSYTALNLAVTKFSLATSYSKKGVDGNYEDKTSWHAIVLFGASDFIRDRLKKGAKIGVEGMIDYNEYEKDGVKKYFTQIIANKYNGIIILDRTTQKETMSSQSKDNASEDLPF